MLFSIIINTHNQKHKLVERAIDSCLNQNFDSKLYEIIVTDTSDYKYLSKQNSNQRIKIIESDKFSEHPCINQMLSIKKAATYASGRTICLLDGDDFFSKEKLSVIHSLFHTGKKILNQDNIIGYCENKSKTFKISNKKFYKNNYFYKKFFNSWPLVFGTSSISVSLEYLNEFFSNIDPHRYNFLAIDTLMIIYFQKKECLCNYGKKITFKSFHQDNLDKNFSKRISKKFWLRRMQQHNYYQEINDQKYVNLDLLLCKFFS
jgi:cellulose synthase/poly-beta-1,6-N-acetylglucosamine synthase-like glycosyltransferase